MQIIDDTSSANSEQVLLNLIEGSSQNQSVKNPHQYTITPNAKKSVKSITKKNQTEMKYTADSHRELFRQSSRGSQDVKNKAKQRVKNAKNNSKIMFTFGNSSSASRISALKASQASQSDQSSIMLRQDDVIVLTSEEEQSNSGYDVSQNSQSVSGLQLGVDNQLGLSKKLQTKSLPTSLRSNTQQSPRRKSTTS